MLLGFENGKRVPYHLGHFFIAVDISSFIEVERFRHTAGEILRTLRTSRRMPGEERIYTAGEKEHAFWLENRDKGVPVNGKLQEEILQMQKELDLHHFEFSFG